MVQKSRKSFRKFPYNLGKGSLLEAKDVYNTWYPVKVISVKENKIHVHFCNWSSRYDTWYPLTSDCLRPLMLATSRNGRDSKVPLCAPRPTRKSQETTQYESGAYVMALWRNDYEYLAKVLAHRQRQGDRSEYRLRYIWDNAVEWTPVSRIRKASQYEIDYVLQFCKQQTLGSGVATSVAKNNTSPESHISHGLTTRSHMKRANQAQSFSTDSKDSQHPVRLKKSSEPRSDTSVEQDGMVYDKAVLQFHEACRKRREMKRQAAVEANNLEILSPSRMNSNTITDCPSPMCESPSSGILECRTGDRKRKSCDDSFAYISGKMRRSSEPSTTSTCNELKVDDPSCAVNNQALHHVSGMKDRPTDIKPSIQSPLSTSSISSDPQQNSATYGVDKTESSSSNRLILTISKQKIQLSQQRSPVHLTSPNHRRDDIPNGTNPGTVDSDHGITKTAAPVIYPCPYCTRRLRHAKLLNAHISNYHKTEVKAEVNPTQMQKCESSPGKRNERPSSLSRHTSTTDSRLDSKEDKTPRHLLACHRCDTCTYVSSGQIETLLQCRSCLSWVHQACYPAPFRLCDGCQSKSRRARPSRRDECHLSGWQCSPDASRSAVDKANHCLISDTCELLDWTHRLAPLVKTGWTLLDNSRQQSGPASATPPVLSERTKRRPSPHALAGLPDFADIESSVKDGIDIPVSLVPNSVSGNDAQPSTENVENIYMELENFAPVDRMISLGTQMGSNLMGCVTHEANPSVPLSAVASSTESSYWRVTEDGNDDDEVLVADSSDALTGFLQDLGPNVLPDLEDIDYLTPVSADSTCPRSTCLLNGQDDDLLSTIQSHGNSILDTPVKEALSVANLLNPVPVSIMSSVLQAGGNALCPLPMDTQGDDIMVSDPNDILPGLPRKIESCNGRSHSVENPMTAVFESNSASELLTEAPFRNMRNTVPQSTVGVSCTAPHVALSIATSSSVSSLPASDMDWLRRPPPTTAALPTMSASAAHFDPKSTGDSVDRTVESTPVGLVGANPDRFVLLPGNDCSSGSTGKLEEDDNDYLDHQWEVLANSKANQNLDHLDQLILAPLERAISVMEAQLDCITSRLFVDDAPSA